MEDLDNTESGPLGAADGSHQNRRSTSPTQSRSRSRRESMTYSWSTPDFSIYSNPLKPKAALSPSGYHAMKALQANDYQQIFQDFIKGDIPFMSNSFPLCPHKHHCFQNAVMKGFFRSFSAAFIFKTSLNFLTKLFAGKITWQHIKRIYLDNGSVLFGIFVGLMSFCYKAILCTLRRIRKKDPIYHKSIAGFVCGVCILLDNKTRRKQIAVYCLVRALADLVKLGVHYKHVPNLPHSDIAVFTASQTFIMYGLLHGSNALDHSYYKWIKNMGNLTEQQCQLSFRSRINPSLQYRLPSEKWAPCPVFWHHDTSCVRHNCFDWVFGLARGARIYLPVHFLPNILFDPKRILKDPLNWLQRKSFNVMVSSVFLTTYQCAMKLTICLLRNAFQRDDGWHCIVGGVATGLALIIENEHRRPELMLYCIPRALEVMFRLVPNKNHFAWIYGLLRSTYLPVLSFQIAMSVWMTIIAIPKGKETSNSINMTVLKIIFGSKH